MDVTPFYFKDNEGKEGVVGVRATKGVGATRMDLYAVAENDEGPSVSNNLFLIADQITRELFGERRTDDFEWTLSVGSNRTWVNFSTLDDTLYKLDFSNKIPVERERVRIIGHAPPLEQYNETPKIERSIDVSDDWDMPTHVYPIPCDAAPDGYFYMEGEFEAPHMKDDFETVLVSTDKLIAKLAEDDPKMLRHADNSHGKGDSQRWADTNKMEFPQSCGYFGYGPGHFTVNAGNAEMLRVIQNLDLPFVPITVSREDAARVKQDIGHGYTGFGDNEPTGRPIYEN